MTTQLKYPEKSLNADGKIFCCWILFPTRLPPIEAVETILKVDIFSCIARIFYALMLAWAMMKGEDTGKGVFWAWWQCQAEQWWHFLSGITILAVSLHLYRKLINFLDEGKLRCWSRVWFFLRGWWYLTFALFYIPMLAFYVDEWFWAHSQQHNHEKEKDIGDHERVLKATDYDHYNVNNVRATGSYYMQMNAMGLGMIVAIFWIGFYFYLYSLGNTAIRGVDKMIDDKDRPLESVRVRSDPLKKRYVLLNKNAADTWQEEKAKEARYYDDDEENVIKEVENDNEDNQKNFVIGGGYDNPEQSPQQDHHSFDFEEEQERDSLSQEEEKQN